MRQKGFTIIEILIVLVVIGIMIAVALFTFKAAECEKYRHAPITSTPTKCVDYLVGE